MEDLQHTKDRWYLLAQLCEAFLPLSSVLFAGTRRKVPKESFPVDIRKD